RLRAAAVVQAAVVAITVAIVMSRARLALPAWADDTRFLVWVVVAIALVALVLNVISRSAGERRIWVPVAVVMLGSSLLVALAAR
ncbi:MAG TPA: hypothetical protein VKA85_10425, partial [Candidatus Limnocylindrales bacterium]|nr:hypothetical protein [Candidatus Limnocylindrales bacterium]